MVSMLPGTGKLDVPSGDSSRERPLANGEPSFGVNTGKIRDIRCSVWCL
jgi:hypothetical protein